MFKKFPEPKHNVWIMNKYKNDDKMFKKFPNPKHNVWIMNKYKNDDVSENSVYLASKVDEVLAQWRQQLETILKKSTKYDQEWYIGYKTLAEDLIEALPK